MSADDFDLCITTDDMGPVPHSARRLYDEEIMPAVPADHPRFSLQPSVQLGDIADENFIMTRSGSALRIRANRLFRQAGMEPRIIFEGDILSLSATSLPWAWGWRCFHAYHGSASWTTASIWCICRHRSAGGTSTFTPRPAASAPAPYAPFLMMLPNTSAKWRHGDEKTLMAAR